MNDYIDSLIDIVDTIPLTGELTILTGSNASGKSLIRKLLHSRCVEEAKLPFANWSMQKRTESNPNFGALSSMMMDNPYTPTSSNSVKGMQQLLKWKVGEDRVIVIDEPEIGCSDELQHSIAYLLLSLKYDVTIKGLVIITHSRIIVDLLKDHSTFFNLDGYKTANEWLNRKIVPLTLEELKTKSTDLFIAVRDRQNQ